LELVTSRDYREREAPEWYAAAILNSVLNIRLAIKRGDADFTAGSAVELGILITEAKDLGFFKLAGAMGPANRKRRKSPYPLLARHLFRNYLGETDEYLFNMVPTISNDDLPLGRYKFYRDAVRIHAEEKVGGEWKPVGKPLKLSAFRKHMTEERKRISR